MTASGPQVGYVMDVKLDVHEVTVNFLHPHV